MNNLAKNHLNIVVPCYNEEKSLERFYQEALREIVEIKEKINSSITYSFIFVNDGSSDNTLEIMHMLKARDYNVRILDFSRNFGKESAILAGLQESKSVLDSMGGGVQRS
ncbi:glycosyltransferase [Helicobacter brantae]|uniref:glycosyltransferase n=1 Tax=Helicobacter brantae TaxID=375927 RepID=UPI00147453AA|nr:glycosyltransferase [Helicobacter brantae]